MLSAFESLCNEILFIIFGKLDPADLISLLHVSHRFYFIKKEHYLRKIRLIIRHDTKDSIMERLLDKCYRLCMEQPTSQQSELDPTTEICVLKFTFPFEKEFIQKIKQISVYTNITQLIFIERTTHFTPLNSNPINLIFKDYLFQVLPKFKMMKLIFYHIQSDFLFLNHFIDDYLVNLTNLRHLTLFCRSKSFARERSRRDENKIEVSAERYEKFLNACSRLDELYIGGFNGDCFPVILPMLSKTSPNIRRLGFYYDRLETCLRMIESINNPLAGQITHLTLHSFGNDYANVDAVRSKEQLEILTKRFSGLEFVGPVEAKNLFGTKQKENTENDIQN